MKRFKLKWVGVLAVCALSVLGYAQGNRSEKLDDLMLENIEALADEEDYGKAWCFGSGSVYCPNAIKGAEHVLYTY